MINVLMKTNLGHHYVALIFYAIIPQPKALTKAFHTSIRLRIHFSYAFAFHKAILSHEHSVHHHVALK